MIEPTVGRIVLFTPAQGDTDMATTPGRPLAAIVAYVNSDSNVNLAVFDASGRSFSRTSVPLIHDDAPTPKPITGFYCEWPAYQKVQVAKKDALEKDIADAKEKQKTGAEEEKAAEAGLKEAKEEEVI